MCVHSYFLNQKKKKKRKDYFIFDSSPYSSQKAEQTAKYFKTLPFHAKWNAVPRYVHGQQHSDNSYLTEKQDSYLTRNNCSQLSILDLFYDVIQSETIDREAIRY